MTDTRLPQRRKTRVKPLFEGPEWTFDLIRKTYDAMGDIALGELGPLALQAQRAVKISTTCTVFAESEVLSWLSRGRKVEEILLGVHQSIVSRSLGLMRRVGIESEVTFTGGVAKNIGMVEGLNQALGFPVNVSEDSHFMGALGAALFAMDRITASRCTIPEVAS